MNSPNNDAEASGSDLYNPARSFDDLVLRWLRRLRTSQFVHYADADRLRRNNLLLGVPVVIFTAVIGTSVFASLSSDEGLSTGLRVLVGVASIVSAVLASLQTFLGFAERAEKHRSTAARFGIVRREAESLVAEGIEKIDASKIDHLRKSIDSLAVDAPPVSDSAVKSAQTKMRHWNDSKKTI